MRSASASISRLILGEGRLAGGKLAGDVVDLFADLGQPPADRVDFSLQPHQLVFGLCDPPLAAGDLVGMVAPVGFGLGDPVGKIAKLAPVVLDLLAIFLEQAGGGFGIVAGLPGGRVVRQVGAGLAQPAGLGFRFPQVVRRLLERRLQAFDHRFLLALLADQTVDHPMDPAGLGCCSRMRCCSRRSRTNWWSAAAIACTSSSRTSSRSTCSEAVKIQLSVSSRSRS